MEFRKAVASDVQAIMKIIGEAQAYFKANGIDQWQNGYPNRETIKSDIEEGYGYVLEDEGVILGTVALSFDGEKNYDEIHDGQWLTQGKYAVIHRMAVAEGYKGRGISSTMMKNIEELCHKKGVRSIKIDTHKENLAMQGLIQKNNFRYCGIIFVEDQTARLAYEK